MAGRGKGVGKGASGKRQTANSRATGVSTGSTAGGSSQDGSRTPMDQLMAEGDGEEALTAEEMDVEEHGEDNVVEVVEGAIGPLGVVVTGKVRDVETENIFHRT